MALPQCCCRDAVVGERATTSGRLLEADAGLLRCWRFSRARGCPCLSGRRGVQRHVEEDDGVETVKTVGKRGGGGGGGTAEEEAALLW